MDRVVVATHASTVDRPHNMKGYAILSIHHRSHGPGRVQAGVASDSPECGGPLRRVRRRGPRSHCRASIHGCVGSTRSWSKRAHIQGFKGAACASTAASTERGGAGLAGVWAPVLRRAWMTGDGGKLTLTTKRRRKQACRRGRGYDGEDW
jgi:hypothetical protein